MLAFDFARPPVPDAHRRVGRDPDDDVLVGGHLDLALLLRQLRLLGERVLVPDLDGAVAEAAEDGVPADLDVVDVVRALEGRLTGGGRGQAAVPPAFWTALIPDFPSVT